MDDKCIMENLLHTTKAACDLYMHGTIEAATVGVRQVFSSALNDTLTMQDNIYNQMSAKGWYTTEQAPQQKIQQVKQKFSAMS
ncbi:MAG: spore coat protein [Oscillospiraceae bacterium]|nr:spore coat protein [Oscillospiraceae bacterium]